MHITLHMPRQIPSEMRRFVSFLLMGGVCALLNLSIIGILTALLRWPYLPSALIATETSVFVGFLLNDHITFRDLAGRRRSWLRRCLGFHGAAVAGQLLTFSLAAGLITILHFIPFFAQASALGVMAIFNFVAQRYVTYGRNRKATLPAHSSPWLDDRDEPYQWRAIIMQKWKSRLRYHAVPLILVLLAALVGQAAVLIQHPLVATFNDTATYLAAERLILSSPVNLVQTFRMPGYPLLLVTVFTVAGSDNFSAVVFVQAVVAVLSVFECYVLTFRLSHRRWIACIIASAIGVNIYIMSWERTILSEALSWWSLITLFLCYERFLRKPTIGWGIVVGIVGFVAIMVRPFNVFIPFLLLLMVLLKSFWARDFRAYWRGVTVSAALIGVLLVSYIGVNAGINGFFGLTYEQNITLLGKVIEYNMQDMSVDPQYAAVQSDVHQFVATGQREPWLFPGSVPEKNYTADNWAVVGGYARSVILHHPFTFFARSIGDLYNTWLAPGTLYPTYGAAPDGKVTTNWALIPGVTGYLTAQGLVSPRYEPLWVTAIMNISTIELDSYWFLPLLLIGLVLWLWRRSLSVEKFTMFVMGLVVTGAICLAAMGNYAEFYRVRSPVDWAMIIVCGITLAEIFTYITQKEKRSSVSNAGGNAHLALGAMEDMPVVKESAAMKNGKTVTRMDEVSGQPFAENSDFVEAPFFVPEISIVLPCLNEEEAIGGCIDTIQEIIARRQLSAEILVVDNASTDQSAAIAREHGARVVEQPVRGYGNAYLKGFEQARGKYIVMADADNTYDFNEIETFVEPLRQGYDLVMGNRFSGRMAKGAMTWSHRYIGNPILSGLLNLFFHTGIRDAHCGMRAFKTEAYQRMRLQTGGMEFASEMVINAAKAGLKIAERPIGYYPRVGDTKLRTVRDGWRHLRFLLLYSPTHLFLAPGAGLLLIGLVILSLLLPGPFLLFGHDWDVHMMILASVLAIIGLQIISFGLFARFFSLTEELDGERDRILQWLTKKFSLERGLLIGAVIFGAGLVIDGFVLVKWIAAHLGPLNEVRPAIYATTLMAIGIQIMFGSFFLSFLQFRKSLSKNTQARTQQIVEEQEFAETPVSARGL